MKNSNLLNRLLSYSHEKQSPQRFGRYAAMLIMLLTLGVGQMWADNGDFYNMYLSYTFEGAGGSVSGADNNTGVAVDAGTLTSGSLVLTGVYLKCWDDWGSNYKSCGGQLCYTNKGGSTQYIICSNASGKDGNNYEWQNSNPSLTIASYNQASGSYAFESWGQTWGCDGHPWGDRYFPKSSGHYTINYKIAPPALSSFTITPTGAVAGNGSSGSPYIIPYGGDLTLVSSGGTKHHTDGNSSVQFSLNNSTWGTSSTYTTKEIEDITSTTKTYVNLYAKCYNSTASLSGAVNTTQVYYRAAALNTITLNKGTDGTSAGNMTIREYATEYTSYTAATKTGWSLKGYYTAASDGTQIIDANGNLIANKSGYTNSSGQWIGGAKTLYAQWKQTYAVTYYANYPAGATSTSGSVPTDATEYSSGATVTVKTNSGSLAAGGFTFSGWNTQPDGLGTDRAASSTFSISANTALYAKWTENMTTVTVSVSPSGSGTLTVGGAAHSSGNTTTAGVATNRTVVVTPYPGYRFSSWGTTGNATGTSSTNTYTLKGNGSGSIGTLTATQAQTYAYLQGRMTIYTAVGRSTKKHIADGEGGWDESSNRMKMDYDGTNHRFYLHTYMTPKELSTEQSGQEQYFWFKTSTSSSSDDTNPIVHRPSTGRTLTAAGTGNKKATETSTGTNSIWFDNTSTTNGYAIIYFDEAGVWYELEHSLVYDVNGGSGTVPSTTCHLNGTNATAGSGSSISKSNYSFGGWNTNQYITGSNYAAGASVPMSANTTLYAKWTRSVTLDRNTATTGSTSVTATYNCATLPSITNPSKDGYTFGGWYTANDGSGLEVINTSKALQASKSGWTDASSRFTRTADGATLYAKWTQTVTLNANTSNHGSGSNTSATIVLNATTKSSITHCTPATGYHLVGYYTAATGGTKILDEDGNFAGTDITVSTVDYIKSGKWVKADATTLYAHYEANTYTIVFNKNDGSYVGTATGTTASVNATYDANVTLTANGFSLSGYTFAGWATTSGGAATYSNGATLTTPNFTSDNGGTYTLYAKWTENTYSTTVSNDGHGTVSPTGTVNISHHTGTTLTATPSTNYVFKDWTISGGGITPTSSTTNPQVFKATTAGGSIRANFADEWNIKGNQWDSWGTYNGMPATGNANEFSVTLTLAARTNYEFKVVKRVYNGDDVYYTKASTTFTRGGTTSVTGLTTGGTGNHMTLTTDAAGDYTFTFKYDSDASKMKVTITFPTAYTVTFGKGTGGATITATASASGTLSSGNYVASGEDVTFTQTASTGYTFDNWYTTKDEGGSVVTGMGKSDPVLENVTGNKNVYSRYIAKEYEVTFDYSTNSGSKTDGEDENNATFDQATISVPTVKKDGYCFDGWYSAASGGVLVIDAEGNLQSDVVVSATTWTDGDGKWKLDDEATVYAQFSIPHVVMDKSRSKGLISSMPGYDTLLIDQSFSCVPTGGFNVSYRLLYFVSHGAVPIQPTIKYGTISGASTSVDTIIMPVGDGANMYEVVADLKTGTTRGSGTPIRSLDTIRADVESSYLVKIRYQVDGIDIQPEKGWYLYPSFRAIGVNLPKSINGYALDHVDYGVGVTEDSRNELLDGYLTVNCYSDNPSTITAVYKPKANTVYFFNYDFDIYDWSYTRAKIYDYGTTRTWSTVKGVGSEDMTGDTIKPVTIGSDIWMASIGESTTKFAFTFDRIDDYEYFYAYTSPNTTRLNAHVIYCTDFNAALPMFVPVATNSDDYYVLNHVDPDPSKGELGGEAHYYRGFWVKYSPNIDETGYYLKVYDKVSGDPAPKLIQSIPMRLTPTGEGGSYELTATMDLEGGKTYGFKFTKATGGDPAWYGKSGTLTSSTPYLVGFNTTDDNCGLTTTSAGDYTFHVYCADFGTKAVNAASANDVQGQWGVKVDFATIANDLRVVYQDDEQINLTKGESNVELIASQTIRARENGQDTVTFFVRKDATNRSMKIQKFNGSAWADVEGGAIALTNTAGQPFTVSTDTTYQIYLQQNEDGTSIAATGMDYYDGDYYIRTDCVDEHKWDYKQSLANHKMTETDYGMVSTQPYKFSHYFVHWCSAGTNVKYVIATKYSPCLTDTVITDDYADQSGGNLGAKGANIRFMYNKSTNATKRAYLAGTKGETFDANFLKLEEKSTNHMKDTTSAHTLITSVTFHDDDNFIYSQEILAKPGLTASLSAKYNGQTQYFLGDAVAGEEILGGTTEEFQIIEMTYDFKTNRLICAWRPSGDSIKASIPINADVMIIRKAQGDAEQIRFNNSGKLSDVKYMYAVIQFDYNDMHGMMNRWDYWSYQHCMYYISFPYDVLVNDIMGVGKMGQDWRLQRYNGAKRAEGWFAGDGVTTFWEDLQPGDTLKAYEGYSLLLNRNRFNGTVGNIWDNKGRGSSVYLYFPSATASTGIVQNDAVTIHVPEHECTLDRPFQQDPSKNHKVVDSHWNMIGTPLFEDKTASTIEGTPLTGTATTLQYIYSWNYFSNTLSIQAILNTGFEFKTMYGYMAQFAGDITFSGSTVNKIVAAQRNEETKNYRINLNLSKDDQFVGRTYVELRENAVDSFLLNEDVCMLKNGVNADLYTFAGPYESGANILTVGNHTVPVGIDVIAAGTYVFSMPDNFDGEVILVDSYTQTRTNLMMEDYELALPTGTIDDRFLLEININKTPTAIDGVGDGEGTLRDGKVHKFIMNDQMYILKDGQLFDARGNRVR